MEITSIIKVLIPGALSFIIGILITPIITHYLYTHKLWKKKGGKITSNGETATVFNSLHEQKEVGTPRFGGSIIWLSVFITTLIIWSLSKIFQDVFGNLDFLSRSQTWIPLAVLFIGAVVGAIDDFFEIRTPKKEKENGGLSLKIRLLIIGIIGILCGLWFYTKLDISFFNIPLLGEINFGIYFVIIFALIMIFMYSGGVIDGLDGLAGGVFAIIFACYGTLAFFQNQIDISALCSAIVGGTLSFLWFNIPPARFFMSETGTMPLTATLAIIALTTDSLGEGYGISILPVIALPLFVTSLSNIVQVLSKKTRAGKKVFRIAPLHHHLEAIGWQREKIVMRYWILSVIFGIIGVILALI